MSENEIDLPMPFDNSAHEALMSVLWTALIVRKESKRFFGANRISSDAQFNVLMILKYSGKTLTQNEIGKRLLVDKSNVTGLIDRMERDGLIARKDVEGDRRSYHIVATAEGRRITDTVEKKYMAKVSETMRLLGKKDLAETVRLMKLIRKGLVE